MNGTANVPAGGSPPGGQEPRSGIKISGWLFVGIFCAFLTFVAGMLVLIWEPMLGPIVGSDERSIDRMLTVVGRQLNFISLFVACFSLFMAVAGIFINRHFKMFDERQQEFQKVQKELDDRSRRMQQDQERLQQELNKLEKTKETVLSSFSALKTECVALNEDLKTKVAVETGDLSQRTTIFNAEFVLATLLPDPCSTQQIPVEMTYVLHQLEKLIKEFVHDDLDKLLEGNGALIRLARALYRYGVNADDENCIQLLEEARSTLKASPEMVFKILYRLGICHRQKRQWQRSISAFRELRSSCEEGGYFARYRVLANLGEAITWLGWRAHLIGRASPDETRWDENVLSQLISAYADGGLHSFLPILHEQTAETFTRDPKNHVLFFNRFLQNAYECALAAWKLHMSEKGTARPPLLLTYYLTKILYFMLPADVNTLKLDLDPEKLWLEPSRRGLEDYLRLENVSTTERVDPFMALNYRLCLIYVYLCDCRHFVQNGKAAKEAEVQKMIENLHKNCSGDRLSAEAKVVKLRIPSFEPTIYSEHSEREVDISTFAAEVAKLV